MEWNGMEFIRLWCEGDADHDAMMPGVRLCASLVISIWCALHIHHSVYALTTAYDCTDIGAYLSCVAAVSLLMLVSLYIISWFDQRSSRCASLICYMIITISLTSITGYGVLASFYVHWDRCWDYTPLRSLAVLDVILSCILLIVVILYVFQHFIIPSRVCVAVRHNPRCQWSVIYPLLFSLLFPLYAVTVGETYGHYSSQYTLLPACVSYGACVMLLCTHCVLYVIYACQCVHTQSQCTRIVGIMMIVQLRVQ